MYEFEYFKCKFVRIESKISGLAELESASFSLSANCLSGNFPHRIRPLIR
jgi:hypothetical protein